MELKKLTWYEREGGSLSVVFRAKKVEFDSKKNVNIITEAEIVSVSRTNP